MIMIKINLIICKKFPVVYFLVLHEVHYTIVNVLIT